MKRLLIFAIVFLTLAFSVSAWHCSDSEQLRPDWNPSFYSFRHGGYGPWGDNGLLNGTTWGWFNSDVNALPAGCTGALNGATCNDYCNGTTLVEFYCTDRPSHATETVIKWHNYENSTQCNEVPEFGPVAIIVALTGAIAGFVIIKRR